MVGLNLASILLGTVLILLVTHKVSYQLTAAAGVARGAQDGDEGTLFTRLLSSRLLSSRLLLGLSGLLSIVCVPVMFLHLDSLAPDVFGGTKLHPYP
jgi:hypothetical protein